MYQNYIVTFFYTKEVTKHGIRKRRLRNRRL